MRAEDDAKGNANIAKVVQDTVLKYTVSIVHKLNQDMANGVSALTTGVDEALEMSPEDKLKISTPVLFAKMTAGAGLALEGPSAPPALLQGPEDVE